MEQMYRFGPISVCIRNLPDYPQWPFWRWKLDQFRIDGGAPDIIVDNCPSPTQPEGAPVWSDEGNHRQFFLQADGTVLWQQTDPTTGGLLLQYAVRPDWSTITLLADHSATVGMGAFESLTFLMYYAFLHRQVLTFHGVLMEANGRGFLLCADSGVGKTTHARMWRDHKNALILNGDRAACYQEKGQWFGFGTPWCGTSGEYINRSAPLQAVVLLRRGTENRISPANGMSLLHHTVYPAWDQTATEVMLSLLDRFLTAVPVLQLECTPDVSAVDTLYEALENLSL